MSRLRELVSVWQATAADVITLARNLDDSQWLLPTDLPGWSVRDVMAHLAAIESELAGDAPLKIELGEAAAHVNGLPGVYTEQGVVARRDRTPAELVAEFETAVAHRVESLAGEPLDDPAGRPPVTPGGIGWDWQTLLRNRNIDLWVHEQDIRRAVGRPGGLTTPAAALVQGVFVAALPYVVAKLVRAPSGTTVVVDITGPISALAGIEVDENRRGHAVDPATLSPDVHLTLGTEEFTILAAGRRTPNHVLVRIDGDTDLAARILTALNLTP